MARLQTPLLSFSARQKLAGALTFAAPRNRPQAREYATPANPRSPAQLAHRAIVAQAVAYWTSTPQFQIAKDSWNLYAKVHRRKYNGYQAWIRAALKAYTLHPQCFFMQPALTWVFDNLTVGFFAPFYIGPPTDPGTFHITYGPKPDQQTYSKNAPAPLGSITIDTSTYPYGVVYLTVKKDNIPRNGITYKVASP